MATWLIWIVTIAYFGTAVDLWINAKVGLGWMFFGYAIANLGFLYHMKEIA